MRAALGNLVVYSVLMFTLPFVTMYLSYHYIFVGERGVVVVVVIIKIRTPGSLQLYRAWI